jgi:superfamily II DNA or RNA helicase
MGEFIPSELETMFDTPTIVGDAVSHYKQFASGKRALVFCVSIEASKHMAQAFREAGYSAVHADGHMDMNLRDQMMADFDRGAITVICNVGLYTEGLDIVGVECIIQLRPTQSRAMYLQMIGRGLRSSPGKDECIIIDACANWQRHGLPTDPYEWALTYSTERKKKTASISVRVCSKCFAASSSHASICSNCGEPFPVISREVERREGELTEITAEMWQRKAERQMQGRAQSLEQLREIARRTGKNPKWAEYVWNARQAKRAGK